MKVTFINENADKIEIAALSGVTGSTDSLRALAVIAWTEAKLQIAAGALWETSGPDEDAVEADVCRDVDEWRPFVRGPTTVTFFDKAGGETTISNLAMVEADLEALHVLAVAAHMVAKASAKGALLQ